MSSAPPAQRRGGPTSAAIDAEVERIVAARTAGGYTHDPIVDEAHGVYALDCSTFASYVLMRAAPAQYQAILAATQAEQPLARDYAAFIAAIPDGQARGGVRRVMRARELVPGDLVAWTLDPARNHGDTGHVLFVTKPLGTNPDRNDELLFEVADSTYRPHGTVDPRAAEHRSGVAAGGRFGLIVDLEGVPVAYRWNGGCGPDQATPLLAMGHAE